MNCLRFHAMFVSKCSTRFLPSKLALKMRQQIALSSENQHHLTHYGLLAVHFKLRFSNMYTQKQNGKKLVIAKNVCNRVPDARFHISNERVSGVSISLFLMMVEIQSSAELLTENCHQAKSCNKFVLSPLLFRIFRWISFFFR